MIIMTDGLIDTKKKVPHMTLIYPILESEEKMKNFLKQLRDKKVTEEEAKLLLCNTLEGKIKVTTAKRYLGSLVTYKMLYLDEFYFLSDLSVQYLDGKIKYKNYILKCLCRNLEWAYFLPDVYDIVCKNNSGLKLSKFITLLKANDYEIENVDTIRRYLSEILKVLDLCGVIHYYQGTISLGERDRKEILSYAHNLSKELLTRLQKLNRRDVPIRELRKLYHLTIKAHLPNRKWRYQILKHQNDFDEFMKNPIIDMKKEIKKTKGLEWQLQDSLYSWQSKFLERWMKQKRGIAKVVTGAGKTHLAMAIIQEMKKIEPNLTVTIVVPTIVLLEQWYDNLIEKLHVEPSKIALKGGDYSDSFDQKEIFIFVINSAIENNLIGKVTEKLQANLLIVDECHKSGAPKFREIYKAKRSYTLGLSATPERESDDAFNEVIIRELGEIIGNYTYKNAFDDGIIPKYNIYNYGVVLTNHEKRKYENLTKEISKIIDALNYKYPQLSLDMINIYPVLQKMSKEKKDPLINQYFKKIKERKDLVYQSENRKKLTLKILNRVISKNIQEYSDETSPLYTISRNDRVILFHELIGEINRVFVELDSPYVSIYHSGFPSSLNRIGLTLYRRGITRVLLSAKALIEGVDIPSTNIGIIMASSSSKIQRIQSLGRILRKAKGKTHTTLFNIYVKNTTDEKIFYKLNWNEVIGESNIEYRLWSEFGEFISEKPLEKEYKKKEEIEEEDLQKLEIGDFYLGDTKAIITLSFKSNGKLLLNKPKELAEKITFPEAQSLWFIFRKFKPTGGRLIINKQKHLILREKINGEFKNVYIGKLEEYSCLKVLMNFINRDK